MSANASIYRNGLVKARNVSVHKPLSDFDHLTLVLARIYQPSSVYSNKYTVHISMVENCLERYLCMRACVCIYIYIYTCVYIYIYRKVPKPDPHFVFDLKKYKIVKNCFKSM